jgi:transcriptional regulator EpsA
MQPFISLNERELEYFLRIVDRSFQISRRNQFFLWAQGELQGLIPHQLLICALNDYDSRTLRTAHFCGVPLPQERIDDLCSPCGSLVACLFDRWGEIGRPILACPSLNGFGYRMLKTELERLGLANVAAHGIPDSAGGVAGCVGFVGVPESLSARHAYILQLVVPHLHAALTRVIAGERFDEAPSHPLAKALSEREREVLRWIREGKSNAQIAVLLGVSPLTVKNHVQNILKKLHAQNRAQAVAFAVANRLIAMQ